MSDMVRNAGSGGFAIVAHAGGNVIGTGVSAEQPERSKVRVNESNAAINSLAEWLSVIWLTPAMDRLFADGAAAVVCEAEEIQNYSERPSVSNNSSGIIDSILCADGSGVEHLLIRSPGTSTEHFLNTEDVEQGFWYPKMEGKTVFKHAVTRMCDVAETLMKKHNLKAQDIDYLFPHQANFRISEFVREKIGLPAEKVFNNIHHYGNTTSATIPICLEEALEQGKIKKGNLILSVGFGAGFTWGGNLIRL
jgi:3-oxoacyl-[acyl-carrier-protein] synthase-3